MDYNEKANQLRQFFSRGLNSVEFLSLLVIAFATTVAIYDEIMIMVVAQKVALSDLLMMFLYLEILAMVSRYLQSGELPVRFPLYIGIVALARYLILDLKEMSEWRMMAVTLACLVLAVTVLVIRYGHLRFPYNEDLSREQAVPRK
jgi:protein PsiE